MIPLLASLSGCAPGLSNFYDAQLEPVEDFQAVQVSGAGTAAEHLRRRKGDEQSVLE